MTFDSTQGIPPVFGSCIISQSKEYVYDMKKDIAIKLNDLKEICPRGNNKVVI